MIIPRVINFGPVTLHLYGLVIAIAIYVGWWLVKRRAFLYKVPVGIFEDPILLIPLALAIIGARIYHVLHYWSFYSVYPDKILAIANGGLGIWGALVGIFSGFWITAKIRHIQPLALFDLIAPSVLLGQAIGRIGNFINQEAFGPPTDLSWGIYIEPQNRPVQFATSERFHPTFFYEAILDLIFAFILLKVAKKLTVRGQLFALYLILYSTGRFISEFWRIDTWMLTGFKVAHILALLTFFLGIFLFSSLQKAKV